MDRLTDAGYVPERIVRNMNMVQLSKVYKRLCKYEGTGLTPEQIEAQRNNLDVAYKMLNDINQEFSRLKQHYRALEPKLLEEIGKRMFSAEVYNEDFNGREINNLLCFGDVAEIIDDLFEERIMSNQEAIKVMEKYTDECVSRVVSRAHIMAIGALDKQVPKKALNRKELKNFNNQIYAIRGNCPVCGTEGLLSFTSDYCYHCGQRLDWEDTSHERKFQEKSSYIQSIAEGCLPG